MWTLIWPVLIVVAANTLYNLSAKLVDGSINVYVSLIVTYLVAIVLTLIMCIASGGLNELGKELSKMNWATILMGIGVVGLEVGFLFLYRNGWPVATGHITTSAIVAVVLLLVGILFFKEAISIRQILGIGVCIGGIALITL